MSGVYLIFINICQSISASYNYIGLSVTLDEHIKIIIAQKVKTAFKTKVIKRKIKVRLIFSFKALCKLCTDTINDG